MTVVIVESPAKARTINKYLGGDYTVLASYGHIRDLPSKDGSVRPDEDFAMSWETDDKARKHIDTIARALEKSDKLILATDPDREGEAISWHVFEVLRKKGVLKGKSVERVAFNAVTRSAIQEAISHPRRIDDDLVDAYLARRALDYLVGFTLSPVLWRKLPGARSAGRVQSVALRLVCDREAEIEIFKPREYWSIEAQLRNEANDEFSARLVCIGERKLGKHDIGNEAEARRIETAIQSAHFRVDSVQRKPVKRNPQPPFITSTLQQEASRKLGLSSARAMQLAQRLYEGVEINGEMTGLITYMRTDGVQMAGEAITSCRSVIGSRFGESYLPAKPRHYTAKARNAQEAHEAIRPTDLARHPDDVAGWIDPELARLYGLVWKRTVASQMVSAEIERTIIEIAAVDANGGRYGLRVVGSVLRFDGFLTLYREGHDDAPDLEDGGALPPLREGEALLLAKLVTSQHFTEPPPRYTEASLIKTMEELGIGRPSTYTAILSVLRDRGYVQLEKKRLMPEDKGRLVTAFLTGFFQRYVELDFTADLEEQLDRVSDGKSDWKTLLRDFWRDFSATVNGARELRTSAVLDVLNELLGEYIFPAVEEGGDPRACPSCQTGRLSLKTSRYGPFIGCSNYPECRYTRQIAPAGDDKGGNASSPARLLGNDPETGLAVMLRDGRFGPYAQLGEDGENGGKPKRASLPKGKSPEEVDLDYAIRLLRLPREVGPHPETGKPVLAGFGRYGPFVNHEKTYANLETVDDVFTIGLNRAVSLLADKTPRGRVGAGAPLRELGPHPDDGEPVNLMSGRYGPYVKHGRINATLPKGVSPDTVTLEQAIGLITEKKAQGGKKRNAVRSVRRGAPKSGGKKTSGHADAKNA